MHILEDGYADGVALILSPNADDRPHGSEITLLVIHAISLPPGEFGGDGIVALFTNSLDPAGHPYFAGIATLRVSSHFLIRRDGTVLQFVSCLRRAWHAGVSDWHGRAACNDFSVGIELEGCDDTVFDERQYEALVRLTGGLLDAYPIREIVGHSHIAPGRKTDPGPFFQWEKLGRELSLETAASGGLRVHREG